MFRLNGLHSYERGLQQSGLLFALLAKLFHDTMVRRGTNQKKKKGKKKNALNHFPVDWSTTCPRGTAIICTA